MLLEFKICGVLAGRVALAKPMTVAVGAGIFSFVVQQRHSLGKCYCKRKIESSWWLGGCVFNIKKKIVLSQHKTLFMSRDFPRQILNSNRGPSIARNVCCVHSVLY